MATITEYKLDIDTIKPPPSGDAGNMINKNFERIADLLEFAAGLYCTGVDGNEMISSNTDLTRDMYYDSLIVKSGKIKYQEFYHSCPWKLCN